MRFLYLTTVFLYLVGVTIGRKIHLEDYEIKILCCDTEGIFVTADPGYQILVNVEIFDIPYTATATELHYLIVKSGTDENDGFDGRIFTHYIKTPRQYLSLRNEVYIKFVESSIREGISKREVGENAEETTTEVDSNLFYAPRATTPEFLITFRRYGEALTTTEPTTTEIPWPTPSPDEPANITVNLSGRQPSWYTEDKVDVLREKIINMAIEYTSINNINVNESITTQNVFIDNLIQCPINWPNRRYCVQVTFRLPVFHENEEEYQLNVTNLEIMWHYYSEKYLTPEFTNYTAPETSAFTLWLIIICVTILIFSIILYLFKRFSYRLSGLSARKKPVKEDQDTILYTKAPRNDSLNPHPKQIVPGMFESENQYFDPDATDNKR